MPVWPLLAILAVVSYLAGLFTNWPLLEHVAYALAAIELCSLALVTGGRQGLEASASADRTRITAGDTVEEIYTVSKDGPWPAPWIEIESNHDLEPIRLALYGREEQEIHRPRILRARGAYHLGGGTVRVRDPLGLFSRVHQVLPSQSVLVYPRPVTVPQAVESVHALASSQHRRRAGVAEGSLGNLRDYVAGDPPSRIHWRTSARRNTLMVTEPESARRQAVWLLVDLSGDPVVAERAAGIAAYCAEHLWNIGPVGAIVAGEDIAVVPARRGREHGTHILTALATVHTAAHSQSERLQRAIGQCEHPGALLYIAPEPPSSALWQRLRAVCPVVRVIPVHEPPTIARVG